MNWSIISKAATLHNQAVVKAKGNAGVGDPVPQQKLLGVFQKVEHLTIL